MLRTFVWSQSITVRSLAEMETVHVLCTRRTALLANFPARLLFIVLVVAANGVWMNQRENRSIWNGDIGIWHKHKLNWACVYAVCVCARVWTVCCSPRCSNGQDTASGNSNGDVDKLDEWSQLRASRFKLKAQLRPPFPVSSWTVSFTADFVYLLFMISMRCVQFERLVKYFQADSILLNRCQMG